MLPFCCCYCLLVFSVLLFPPNLFTSISLIDVCELCFVFLFFNFNDLLFWSTPAPLPHCPPPSSSSSSLLFSQHLPSFIKRHTPLKQQLTTTITTASSACHYTLFQNILAGMMSNELHEGRMKQPGEKNLQPGARRMKLIISN